MLESLDVFLQRVTMQQKKITKARKPRFAACWTIFSFASLRTASGVGTRHYHRRETVSKTPGSDEYRHGVAGIGPMGAFFGSPYRNRNN